MLSLTWVILFFPLQTSTPVPTELNYKTALGFN